MISFPCLQSKEPVSLPAVPLLEGLNNHSTLATNPAHKESFQSLEPCLVFVPYCSPVRLGALVDAKKSKACQGDLGGAKGGDLGDLREASRYQ